MRRTNRCSFCGEKRKDCECTPSPFINEVMELIEELKPKPKPDGWMTCACGSGLCFIDAELDLFWCKSCGAVHSVDYRECPADLRRKYMKEVLTPCKK